jgi:uncharacterized protein (DUF305 family)
MRIINAKARQMPRFLGVGLFMALAVTGCGGSAVSDMKDVANSAIDAAKSAIGFNDDDVMFAQMMIPHHEQAIEMADIALDPLVGASDAVKKLATRIKGAQNPEIAKMKAFLTSWKERITGDSSMHHGDSMSGMLSADAMKKLSSLRGAEFDRAWMTDMIEHHEGAIEMAKGVLKDGKDSAVKTLAKLVTTVQDSEILEMKKLLG